MPFSRAICLLSLVFFLVSCGGLEKAEPAASANSTTAALSVPTFTPSVRPFTTAGDQWEPAIASDAYGHVYILYPQWGGFAGCTTCPDPTNVFLMSATDYSPLK